MKSTVCKYDKFNRNTKDNDKYTNEIKLVFQLFLHHSYYLKQSSICFIHKQRNKHSDDVPHAAFFHCQPGG